MCLTKEIIRKGDLWKYFELAKELRVGFIEMLEPRPCGGYAFAGNDVLLTSEERREATEFFIQGNTRRRYRHYPLIYYVPYTEASGKRGVIASPCRRSGGVDDGTTSTKQIGSSELAV
jgi:hypothetical protein